MTKQYRVDNPESISQVQALSLAAIVLEFELENCNAASAPDWHSEVSGALFQIRKMHSSLRPNNLNGIGTPFYANRKPAERKKRKRANQSTSP